MASLYDANFAAGHARVAVDMHGEQVTWVPANGPERQVMAIVERLTLSPVDSPGAPISAWMVTVVDGSTSISDDGRGGVSPGEVVLGIAGFRLPPRAGATAELRYVRRIDTQEAGMVRLEVS